MYSNTDLRVMENTRPSYYAARIRNGCREGKRIARRHAHNRLAANDSARNRYYFTGFEDRLTGSR